jgi:hypothetical protein
MFAVTGKGQFSQERIVAIARELQRRKESKRDLIVPVSTIKPLDDGSLTLESIPQLFAVSNRDDKLVPGCNRIREFTDFQLAERFIDQARAEGEEEAEKFASTLKGKEYADVLGNLMRDLAEKEGAKGSQFLLRMLDGEVRAVLSPKYRILDSADLFFSAHEKLADQGGEVWDARLWDDGFEMYGVRKGTAEEITSKRNFQVGGDHAFGKADGPDWHNPAVRVRNSETGRGGLSVSLSIFREVCKNFAVMDTLHSQIHLGRMMEADAKGIIISGKTREAEAKVIWSTINDAITTALDEERFKALISDINETTTREIQPKEAVELVAPDVSEERREQILHMILASGDRTQYGLAQAVTAQAHDLFESDPAQASELETLGGQVLRKSEKDLASVLV